MLPSEKTGGKTVATINDIEKLRPELLQKSKAELERQLAEIQMAIDRKNDEEKKAAVAQTVIDANRHQQAVIEGLKFLESNHLLSDEVKAAFTTGAGVFNPSLRFKEVTADRIILRKEQAEKPRKARRKRAV
jgi:small-conductance mechanosensitive channel